MGKIWDEFGKNVGQILNEYRTNMDEYRTNIDKY